jgi:spore maturation protein SpmB
VVAAGAASRPIRPRSASGDGRGGFILGVVAAVSGGRGLRGVNVYDAFVDGAKEGFGVAGADHSLPDRHAGGHCGVSRRRLHGRADGRHRRAVAALGLDTDFLPALPVGLMKMLSGAARAA